MASPLFPIETHAFAGVLEAKSASLLRELTRKSPQAGITSASHLEIRPSPETASSGIRQVDALTGGLPRGCLTEVSGADSSGRTSLMLSALAAATRREEICALIDVSDAFDPYSAAAAGVDLGRLLWVRCGSHAQASAWSRRRRQPAGRSPPVASVAACLACAATASTIDVAPSSIRRLPCPESPTS